LDVKFDLEAIDEKYANFTEFVNKSIENVRLVIDTGRKSTQRKQSRRRHSSQRVTTQNALVNTKKIEAEMTKWVDTYKAEYKEEGQCALIKGKEFSENGLLSRYYTKV